MNFKWSTLGLFIVVSFAFLVSGCEKKTLNELVRSSDAATIKRAIAKGADVNERDSDGQTPLHFTMLFALDDISKVLIENGATLNAADNDDWTTFHAACRGSISSLYGFLLHLENGVDIHASSPRGFQPIHFVADCGSIEALDILLDRGADINAKTIHGDTPLLFAIAHERTDMVRALIARGADLTEHPRLRSPLTEALARDHLGMSRLIVNAIVAQGLEDEIRLLPIHKNMILGNFSEVEELIKTGNFNLRDTSCTFTPLALARRLYPDNKALAELIKEEALKY